MRLKILSKRYYLFLLLIVCAAQANAQKYDYSKVFVETEIPEDDTLKKPFRFYKPFIMLNLGASFPVGVYAEKATLTSGDPDAAFALTGMDVSANFAFPLAGPLYSYTSLGFMRNRTDLTALGNLFREELRQNHYDFLEVEHDGYHHLYALTGLLVNLNFTKFSLDIKGQLGITRGKDSELILRFTDSLYLYELRTDKVTGIAFMPSGGLAVKYEATENILFSFHLDYRFAHYKLSTTSNNGIPHTFEYSLRMNAITATAGIGWKF